MIRARIAKPEECEPSRRAFLSTAAALLTALVVVPDAATGEQRARIKRIGVQLYTLRSLLPRDFDGTLAEVAQIGYREVELAGYYGKTPAEFRRTLDRYGLVAPSSHVPFESIRDNLDQLLTDAHTLGLSYLICPNIPESDTSVDGYKRASEVLNSAGEIALRSGVAIGYHNHEAELAPVDGVRLYDVLLENTDPKLVVMEMDLYWMIKGGGDPLAYFAKYPGRFRMVHVKDMGPPPARAMMDVGKGIIDWRVIFAHAKEAGIEHYFVEHDEPKYPIASIRDSYAYLHDLRF